MPLVAATMVCGAAVSGRDGAPLGTIRDVMFDSEGGGIGYAVLAHGGVMGVGEKLFAVPWEELRALDDGSFEADASAEDLAAAQGIDKDAWPASAPADWLA